MELDWRNRLVGGERLVDLLSVVHRLDAANYEELEWELWERPEVALAFHRALLRVAADLLWERAANLRPWLVDTTLAGALRAQALAELLRRAGFQLDHGGRW